MENKLDLNWTEGWSENHLSNMYYYTPEIEEFHVGFEYEGRLAGINGGVTNWDKRIFLKEQLSLINGCEETVNHLTKVVFLTK